jgi:superfamily II DNA or RNA helicase
MRLGKISLDDFFTEIKKEVKQVKTNSQLINSKDQKNSDIDEDKSSITSIETIKPEHDSKEQNTKIKNFKQQVNYKRINKESKIYRNDQAQHDLIDPNTLSLELRGQDLLIHGKLPTFISKFTHKVSKSGKFSRFYPADYYHIIEKLIKNNIQYNSSIKLDAQFPKDITIHKPYKLYQFQQEAVEAWIANNNQGTIILPTGGGKSVVAIDIIQRLQLNTLIVVPTLVLFQQWKERIIEFLNFPSDLIGFWGGGDREIKPITIVTYESAYLHATSLRECFGLLILDEAHHIGSPSHKQIVDAYLTKFRLALTATLSKKESSYDILMTRGFGPIVYEKTPDGLKSKKVISEFELITLTVPLSNPERYTEEMKIFQNYIKRKKLYGNVFQQIIFRVNQDIEADRALKAYNNARKFAFAGHHKLSLIEEILKKHPNEKILIFSDIVNFCEEISRQFLIPAITNRTDQKEREFILKRFRESENSIIVTSRILDEGIDIPDASVGIILAGSGQPRQFIQRLGRLLRKHPMKDSATLYEIVAMNTLEERVSKRRKKVI